MQGVHRHREEGAAPVYHVVEREGTHEEQIVLPAVHQEVDVHLVHDDGLPVCHVGCLQQLAVDLAPDHQCFPHVGHPDGKAHGALLGTNDCHVTEGDGLGSLFRQGDFGQDDAAHEAVDDGSDQGLDDDEGDGTRAERGDGAAAVADGCLRLQGVEERGRESLHVVHAWRMAGRWILP